MSRILELLFLLALILILGACPATNTPGPLPIAHSNNAVAIASTSDGPTLYSFNGLRAGKSHSDVSHQAFACALNGSPLSLIHI